MLPRVIATGWLVLEVTDAPFWVGAVFGIEGLVMLSCGGLGGVLPHAWSGGSRWRPCKWCSRWCWSRSPR